MLGLYDQTAHGATRTHVILMVGETVIESFKIERFPNCLVVRSTRQSTVAVYSPSSRNDGSSCGPTDLSCCGYLEQSLCIVARADNTTFKLLRAVMYTFQYPHGMQYSVGTSSRCRGVHMDCELSALGGDSRR